MDNSFHCPQTAVEDNIVAKTLFVNLSVHVRGTLRAS